MIYQFAVTAANCILNNNLLDHSTSAPMKFLKNQGAKRALRGIGFTGSTAIADTQIDIKINGKSQSIIINSATGAHDKDNVFPVNIIIPPGVDFELLCVDAANTNDVYVTLLMDYVR